MLWFHRYRTVVFRGTRLYDTDETKAMVKGMVDWYKKYKAILDSDALHLRRADGRDIDYILHINPELKEKGIQLIDQVPRKGAGGAKIAFLHPKATSGVLVELCER